MTVKLTSNQTKAISVFVAKMDKIDPKGLEYQKALFQIGHLVRNAAIDNAAEQGIVASGNLISKIGFRIEGNDDIQTIILGAFGVQYARIVELGGNFTDAMRRAMFASLRERGKIGPKAKKYEPKGIVVGGKYKARPFIGPAIKDNEKKIRGILLNLGRS